MDPISTLVKVGLAKGLFKLLTNSVGLDTVVTDAIGTELAGAAAKEKIEDGIAALIKHYVSVKQQHPDFSHIPLYDLNAVALQVEDDLELALKADFLATHSFNATRIVSAIYETRGHHGNPRDFSAVSSALYRSTMSGIVDAVLVICESANGWRTSEARHVQERFDELADLLRVEAASRRKINELLELPKATVAQIETREYREQQDFLDTYFRAIRSSLDSLELFGLELDVKTRAKSQALSIAYVSLNLRSSTETAPGISIAWPALLDQLSKAESNHRLLVRGDAGAGKTTLVRWAALAASPSRPEIGMVSDRGVEQLGPVASSRNLTAAFHRPDAADSYESRPEDNKIRLNWRHKVPLVITLRECADGRLPKPSDIPAHLCHAVDNAPVGLIRRLLERGDVLLMIDGFDETPPGYVREAISRDIAQLIDTYKNKGNIIIVTSRLLDAEPQWIEDHRFLIADIEPMSDVDRDLLVHRWHTAHAERLDTHERDAFNSKASLLIDELNGRPALARLATTPLLCAMLCAQCGVLNYTFPHGEAEIIEGLCHALLWRRDKERALPTSNGSVWDDLTYLHRRTIVGKLANFMVKENIAIIAAATATHKIADTLPWLGRDRNVSAAESQAILQRLSERGGLLRTTRRGGLEFVHNTFKEYLAALIFTHDLEVEFLAANAPREDCTNVCRFAAGVGSPEYVTKLIREILARPDRQPARQLIAIRMTAVSTFLDPALRDDVKRIETSLFPPRTHSQVTALADLGDEVVERLRFSAALSEEEQVFCASALVQIGTSRAKVALRQFASTASDIRLIEQLSRSLNPLLVPYVECRLALQDGDLLEWLPATVLSNIDDTAFSDWLDVANETDSVVRLFLSSTSITDKATAGLARAKDRFPRLATLNLASTSIGDTGVAALAEAATTWNLTSLILDDTKVTDVGVAAIISPDTKLRSLTKLSLNGTSISDIGIASIVAANAGISGWQGLWLHRTNVTRWGRRALDQRFPNLFVYG